MRARRLLALVLRLVGVVEVLAFGAVVMPRAWMEAGHAAVGLGTMPEGPLLDYLIRQASFVYGLHGVALWLIATDVDRYRPLVILTGLGYLAAAPVFWWIDAGAGMPGWWTAGEVSSCLVVGVVILWLSRGEGRDG